MAIIFVIAGIGFLAASYFGFKAAKKETDKKKHKTMKINSISFAVIGVVCLLWYFTIYGGASEFEEMGMNDSQVTVAENAFKELNLGEVSNVRKQDGDREGYVASTDKYKELLLLKDSDNNLMGIYFDGRPLWKAGHKSDFNIEDIYIDSAQRTKYIVDAHRIVEQTLVDPSSADFYMESVKREKEIVISSGKVKARNEFGLPSVLTYHVTFKDGVPQDIDIEE